MRAYGSGTKWRDQDDHRKARRYSYQNRSRTAHCFPAERTWKKRARAVAQTEIANGLLEVRLEQIELDNELAALMEDLWLGDDDLDFSL